ncbi:HPP family protein [Antrihabitans stalactiti]|uniref:CBS domain-containing protein n=1 Tax=Antrihabitans stalactiti TaxID=2584121 RepID=A0A848K6B4_9NOCA|nr:CBS domain-containing protein [Antrihabitans stalactiti]NMN93939.1 CBS domain-containing protein [Antrihabitans stalactiti]
MSIIEFPRSLECDNSSRVCAADLALPVTTISRDATVSEAIAAMTVNRQKMLAVVDAAGRLAKLVTEESIADASLVRLWAASTIPNGPGTASFLKSSVLDFAFPAVSVRQEFEVEDIAKTMLRWRIRAVPIVVDGRPTGIVTWAAVFATSFRNEAPSASISYLTERLRRTT